MTKLNSFVTLVSHRQYELDARLDVLWCLQIDVDGTGVINISELGDALAVVGLKLPAYEVRDLIRKCDSKIKDDCLDFEEFKVVIFY